MPFPDLRIPYHLDGTAVFHRLSTTDNRFPDYYNASHYTELTEEQRTYLNADRRHSVSFIGKTPMHPTLNFQGDLYATDVTFYFPSNMTLTGMFLASHGGDRGFTYDYRNVYPSVSSDTTALDDGTWRALPRSLISSQLKVDILEQTLPDAVRLVRLNETSVTSARMPRYYSGAWNAWDAPDDNWDYAVTLNSSFFDGMFRDGVGIFPLYGEEWINVKALRLSTPDNFRGLGEYVSIWLFGYPTDPDEAGLEYERADGEPLVPENLKWNAAAQSGPHILGPFRLHNTTDMTATNVSAVVSGTISWLTVEITSFPADIVSPIMPYVRARVGGGAWQASIVTGKEIVLSLGDLTPGESSDGIEIELNYTGPLLPPWASNSNLTLASRVGAWT